MRALTESRPPDWAVKLALETAARSSCRSKRGVVTYFLEPGRAGQTLVIAGSGYNGPPASFSCPGRERCAGNCGQRSVHAEVRALRTPPPDGVKVDLVHVELAAGGVVACDGPSCWQCAREVLDVGFVDGVWLYEEIERAAGLVTPYARRSPAADWHRYTADEFYRVTLERCGMVT